MKKLILFLLLIPSLVFAGSIQSAHKSVIARQTVVGGGGGSTEVGYTTIGSSTGSSQGRRIEVDIDASGLDVDYGYVYVSNSVAEDYYVVMAIFTTGGSQVGACSNSIIIPASASTPAWYQVTWASTINLSASTSYHVQYFTTTGDTLTYYYDEVGTGSGFSNSVNHRCPDYFSDSSSRRNTMSIADYEAR